MQHFTHILSLSHQSPLNSGTPCVILTFLIILSHQKTSYSRTVYQETKDTMQNRETMLLESATHTLHFYSILNSLYDPKRKKRHGLCDFLRQTFIRTFLAFTLRALNNDIRVTDSLFISFFFPSPES